jgi:hypothetical protein
MALSDEQKKILADLKEQARLQSEINSGVEGYLEGLKKVKAMNETIKANEEIRRKIIQSIADARAAGNTAEAQKQYEILQVLNDQTKALKEQRDIYADILKEAKLMKMTLAQAGAIATKGLVKTLGNLPGIIANSTSKLKDLFEMDKSIKTSALQMGILSKQSTSFRDTIKDAAMDTLSFGVGVGELAEMQASYSENLGRTVVLSKQGLEDMAAMAKATGLGADAAGEMAAALDSQGLSASRTKDFIEQTMNDSHKMGLNATKVVKNLQQNVKMLNKYSFRNGTKGLAKMAETATKLNVGMESVGSMADKLFNIDGAVEMSAQLQVMGGEWAKMSDPFKLMYMAREDPNALLQQTAEAAAKSFHYANGEFIISAMEIQKLKIIAEQTGQEYDTLAEAGKNAAKFAFIKKQVSYTFDKETQAFIESTAVLDKNGKAVITLNGEPKFVSQLTRADKTALEAQIKEKASLEERAKQSQNFDDKLTNLINMVKTAFLPIVEGINEVLNPLIDDLMGAKGTAFREDLKALGKNIGSFVMKGAEWIKWLAQLAINLGPTGILAIWATGKVASFLFEKANWIANGFMLAEGFLAGTGGTGGFGGQFARAAGPILGTAVGTIAGTMIGLKAGAATSEALGNEDTTTGDVVGVVGGIAGGVGGGALAGAALGTAAFPVIGTAIGALIGAGLGAWGGKTLGDAIATEGVHDGLFEGSTMAGAGLGGMLGGPLGMLLGGYLGNEFSKGRAIVDGGKVTPIDNKDDLLALKKGGAIDKASQGGNSTLKVDFSEIKINGSIMIETPGNPGQGVNLLKDQGFIRSITQLIHQETRKQIGKG